MEPAMHPALEPVQFLLGTWSGSGTGAYPTIDDFAYREEVTFSHNGRPTLAYSQKTWTPDEGSPMHSEVGFWRPQRDGRMEVVLAHPFGVTEILEGHLTGRTIDLKSTTLSSTSSAKTIGAVTRRYTCTGETLSYEIEMAAAGQPLQYHLRAELQRS